MYVWILIFLGAYTVRDFEYGGACLTVTYSDEQHISLKNMRKLTVANVTSTDPDFQAACTVLH